MKKKFTSLLAITGLLLTSSLQAQTSWDIGAATATDVVATLNSSGDTLSIRGTGKMESYYFPKVTPWNSVRAAIKTLVINEGVTNIGEAAFAQCSGITSVTIPNSVEDIERHAFNSCSGLTFVAIPNNVTHIGEYAFTGCNVLDSVSVAWTTPLSISSGVFSFVPNSVQLIVPESAVSTYAATDEWKDFYIAGTGSPIVASGTCGDDLTWVLTLHTLTISGTGAMYNFSYSSSDYTINTPWYSSRSAIKTLVIDAGVTSIGDNAFGQCNGLTGELTIPNSVTSIGSHAFDGSLKKLIIEDGTTALSVVNYYRDYYTGSHNNIHTTTYYTSLPPIDTLYLGRTVTYATQPSSSEYRSTPPFDTALKQVTLSNSLTHIGASAFINCSGLTGALTIPESVTSIGGGAFSGCSGLTAINVNDANTKYSSVDGVLYNKNQDTLVVCPEGKSGALTIPDGVTCIGNGAFYNCSGLIGSLTIPNGVTRIEQSTFSGCSGLTSVTIGNGVTNIVDYAFSGCSGLTSVTIGNSVNSIGGSVFYNNGLTSVTCLATMPPSLQYSPKFSESSDTLYVLANSLNSYKNSNNWNNSFEKIFAGVALDKSTDTLAVDGSVQLTATVAPGIANNNVTWSNRNAAVATVSNNGLVTAVAGGTDTITVTTADGVFIATCMVTVNIPVTDVTLNKATASLAIGGTEQLTATIAPADATNKNVSWTSSNNDIATVDDAGLVTAVAAGTATITVTTENANKTATCVVTVSIPVTDVTLNKATATLAIGGTEQLTATIAPTDATNRNVSWTSSDNDIATVDDAGLVTAVAAGTADITVTTEDGGKTATCVVTVIVPVTNVSLNNTTASLSVGQTKQLTETIAPTNATNQQVAWASSDETVATVSNSGLVTAIKAGTATITVTTEDGSKTATCVVTVTGGGGGNAINTTRQDEIAIYGIANGIAIATKEATSVSIFNIAGQKVYQSVVDGSAEIPLTQGVYVVRVGSESRKVIVK
ncbi:hypothetical protein AGMMS49982_10100 [Bacteroidia bacterium]|nr:hypothetical protein AGMMS49982_10100 [Bacteroidia bacterium]